jgi:RNA polymerase sigma-70 factor (ECF subfamily)
MDIQQAKKFEQFYLDLVDDVFRYTYAKLDNQEEAEDATTETFLRLVNKPDWQSAPNLQVYVLTIARSVIHDIYRPQPKLTSVPETTASADTSSEPDPLVFTTPNFSEADISPELIAKTQQALTTLNDYQKEVLLLRVWEELSFADIANITGLTMPAVESLQYSSATKVQTEVNQAFPNASWAQVYGAIYQLSATSNVAPSAQLVNKILKLLTTQYMPSNQPTVQLNSAKDQEIISLPNPVVSPDFTVVKNTSKSLLPLIFIMGAVAALAGGAVATGFLNNNKTNSSQTSTISNTSTATATTTATTSPTTSIGSTTSSRVANNYTKTCTSNVIEVTVKVPNHWNCEITTEGNESTISVTADGLHMVVSNLGRDGFCINDGSNTDCDTAQFYKRSGLVAWLASHSTSWEVFSLFKTTADGYGVYISFTPIAESGDTITQPTDAQTSTMQQILDQLQF